MIYSPNNEPLALTEGAADEFLKSVCVELFGDSISINGTLYEGAYGESILEVNGIFLYEDCIVVEGQYTDAAKEIAGKSMAVGRKVAERVKATAKKVVDHYDDDKTYNRTKEKLNQARNRSMENFNKVQERNRLLYAKHDPKEYERRTQIINMHQNRAQARFDRIADRIDDRYKKSTNESTIFADIEII